MNGDCVAYHFISIVQVVVKELEAVREALYPCYFPYGHPSVKMLLPGDELALVWLSKQHFRRLRVKLALSAGGLYRKGLLIPIFYPVSAHEYGRIGTGKILVIV